MNKAKSTSIDVECTEKSVSTQIAAPTTVNASLMAAINSLSHITGQSSFPIMKLKLRPLYSRRYELRKKGA